MLLKYFTIPVIAECACFIAAILLLKKRTTIWRLFILFLFFTLCVETTGWFVTFILKTKGNGWLFNFNMFINVVFCTWMLSNAEQLQKIKRLINYIIAFFLFFSIINLIFFQGLLAYNSLTEVFGDIIFIVLSLYFFFLLLREDQYRNVFLYEYFWYANGLLFYSLGAVVLFLYYSDRKSVKMPGLSNQAYRTINDTLNVLLYGSYII